VDVHIFFYSQHFFSHHSTYRTKLGTDVFQGGYLDEGDFRKAKKPAQDSQKHKK